MKHNLPKWLKRAVKEQVVSPEEAQEIHKLSLESDEEEITLPPHLFSAAERINLWETPLDQMGQA